MPKAEATIEVVPIGWDELSAKLGDPRYVWSAMNKALKEMGGNKQLSLGVNLKTTLKDESPVGATKKLRNKTVGQVKGNREDQRLEMRQSAFNNDYPYGVGVRLGTKPHWPPYKALIPWVKVKWQPANDEEARTKAFLLAKSISKKGTKANPYHQKAVNKFAPHMKQIISKWIGKALDEIAAVQSKGIW